MGRKGVGHALSVNTSYDAAFTVRRGVDVVELLEDQAATTYELALL